MWKLISRTSAGLIVLATLGMVWALLHPPTITVIHQPENNHLDTLNVKEWPTWRKEVSEFKWTFLEEETAYILEGEAVITPGAGHAKNVQPITLKPGDLVTFPAGIETYWAVNVPVYKHWTHSGNSFSRLYHRVTLKMHRIVNGDAPTPNSSIQIGNA